MFYPVCFIISIGGTMISFENSETFKNKTVILEHITITLSFDDGSLLISTRWCT